MVFRVSQFQETQESEKSPFANCWFHANVDGPATFLLHRTPYGSWREVVRVVAMRSNGEPGKVYTHRWRVQHLALVIIPALDDGERNIRARWALLHWKMFSRCTLFSLDCITWGCPLQHVATFGNDYGDVCDDTRTKLYIFTTKHVNLMDCHCYAMRRDLRDECQDSLLACGHCAPQDCQLDTYDMQMQRQLKKGEDLSDLHRR